MLTTYQYGTKVAHTTSHPYVPVPPIRVVGYLGSWIGLPQEHDLWKSGRIVPAGRSLTGPAPASAWAERPGTDERAPRRTLRIPPHPQGAGWSCPPAEDCWDIPEGWIGGHEQLPKDITQSHFIRWTSTCQEWNRHTPGRSRSRSRRTCWLRPGDS